MDAGFPVAKRYLGIYMETTLRLRVEEMKKDEEMKNFFEEIFKFQ